MSNKRTFIFSFFANQAQAENRSYGHLTSKTLALKQNIALFDLNLENDNTLEILNTLSSFIVINESFEYPNSENRKERVFKRYLYGNVYLDVLQRQFARQGVLRTPYKLSMLGKQEVIENIPCSLVDFELDKSVFKKMQDVTRKQARLWNAISNDFEYQLSCVEK